MVRKIIGTVVALAIVVVAMEIYFRITDTPMEPEPPAEQPKKRLVVDRKVQLDYEPETQEGTIYEKVEPGEIPVMLDPTEKLPNTCDVVIDNIVKLGLDVNPKDLLVYFNLGIKGDGEVFGNYSTCKAVDTRDIRWCELGGKTPQRDIDIKEQRDACRFVFTSGFMIKMMFDGVAPKDARMKLLELDAPPLPLLDRREFLSFYQLYHYLWYSNVPVEGFACAALPPEYVPLCKRLKLDRPATEERNFTWPTYRMSFAMLKVLEQTKAMVPEKAAEPDLNEFFWYFKPIVAPGLGLCEKHLLALKPTLCPKVDPDDKGLMAPTNPELQEKIGQPVVPSDFMPDGGPSGRYIEPVDASGSDDNVPPPRTVPLEPIDPEEIPDGPGPQDGYVEPPDPNDDSEEQGGIVEEPSTGVEVELPPGEAPPHPMPEMLGENPGDTAIENADEDSPSELEPSAPAPIPSPSYDE